MGYYRIIRCLLLISVFLTACTPKNTEITTSQTSEKRPLTIWWTQGHYPEETESIESAIAAWEKQSGIDIKLSIYPEDDIFTQTQSALAAGNPPDILFDHRADSTISPQWAWEGKLVDVSDIITPIKTLYNQTALQSVYLYNNVTKKRAYYAIPIKQSAVHIHYWRDLLAESGLKEADIPQEWDAFWAFWQQGQELLRKKGYSNLYGIGLSLSTEATNDTFYQFEQILEAYDVELVDTQGNLQVDNPQIRQRLITALDWYTRFYKQGYIPPASVHWVGADNNINFLNRTTLMTLNATMSIPASQNQDQEVYRQKMVTIPFPNEPDGEKARYVVAIKHLVIFSASSRQKEAKQFLSYLVQPENLSNHVKGSLGRWFPVMPSLWQDPYWHDQNDPHVWVASQQFSEGLTRPTYQVINRAYIQVQSENLWGKALERITVDGLSPEAAADEAIARIKQIFAENNNQ